MESNLIPLLLASIIINAILAHKFGKMKEKIMDYEKRLLIKERPYIPSSKELMDLWGERQFHLHLFYAIFPAFLLWKKKIVEMSKENSEELIPERVKNYIENNLRTERL